MNIHLSCSPKIFLLVILIFVSYSNAQKITISDLNEGMGLQIIFDEVPYNLEGDNRKIINYFSKIDESKPGSPIWPSKTLFIAIPPCSKVRVKKLNEKLSFIESVIPKSNPEVELFKDSILVYKQTQINPEYYQDKFYPSDEYEIIGYIWIRDYYCVVLKINTHRYDWNKRHVRVMKSANFDLEFYDLKPYEINKSKLNLFDSHLQNLIINYNEADQFRSFRPKLSKVKLSDDWINFDSEYLKLGVALDGIYRIFKSDLQQFGINTGSINPKSFKMFLKGNQIPIFVSGEEDNTLDDNDFIEFYGSINYGNKNYRVLNQQTEPYNDYIDKYSDTTIYWLSWDGENGLRIDTSSFTSVGVTDTLNYYTNISHFEQNNFLDYSTRNIVEWQNPEWIYNESWIWGNHDVGTRNWNFDVNNLVSNETVKAFFRLRSYASDQNAHDYALSINSYPTLYDSGYINKYEQKILFGGLSSDLLQEGQNTLLTHSFPVANSSVNLTQVDWYEIEYPRYLSLINDSLKFRFNQLDLSALNLVKLTNIQVANHILYKIPNKRRIADFLKLNNEMFFYDSVKTGDEFYISTEEQIKKPKIYYKKKFEDLTSNQIQADYILISHPVFNTESNEYINLIQDNYNVSAKFINVIDIYDQFNYGFFSPEPIKEFLYLANLNWSAPKPAFVFLVGEANYDYHNYKQIEDYIPNYVPSFGHPVSDNWFVIWDSLATVPQMFIGRLAVKSPDQFSHYTEKHREYINQQYNIWNKSYFLLSGGSNENEMLTSKGINDYLRTNLISPRPIGGYTGQLYATENPKSNFGPFSQPHIDSIFNSGGIIISYLGHSGTKIWDNGIENVTQLYNMYNKSPLISDFGCSTGKFAEPDIVSFSENFTSGIDGGAIAYMGNSSLGFTSTAYNYPKLFFAQITDGKYNISQAHILGKERLIQDFGNSGAIKLFVLTNTLFGDPIISLKIPDEPNLNINSSDVKLPSFLDDNLDSIQIGIIYRNLGLADSSWFNLRIEDRLNNQIVYSELLREELPFNDKFMNISVPVKSLAGDHNLTITLDESNEINEIYEDDNSITVRFNVQTSSVRAIVSDSLQVINDGKIQLLNSVKAPAEENVLIQLSSTNDFSVVSNYEKMFDTLLTEINFNNLLNDQRYWYRTSLFSSPNTIFETNSFVYESSNNYNFAFVDSFSTKNFSFSKTSYNNGSIKLGDDEIPLIINSAGFEAGGISKIELRNIDYTNNAQGCGFHNVVIDEATLRFEDYRWFNYWNDPNNYAAYLNFLNTIGPDKLIAISIGGECGGYSIPQELKNKLHEFGSAYIDSVAWGSSWILLGKIGSPVGSVPEDFSRTGPVSFDSIFVRKSLSGSFSTPQINNAATWDSLYISIDSVHNNSQIKLKPIIQEAQPDTLGEIYLDNGKADLSFLNNYSEHKINFLFELFADDHGISPQVKSIKIKYNLIPELGTNYQVVSTTADTVKIGDNVGLKFYVYNVGECVADSFNVKVDVVNEDNSHATIFESLVNSLQPVNRKLFDISYNTSSGSGSKSFFINIDSDNNVRELYEDNNFFTRSFFVEPDIISPTVKITFDEFEVVNGDFVSKNPNIKIALSDESQIPIVDTTAVKIYLNEEPVYYSNNSSILSYSINNSNPKFVVDFKPVLEDGDYLLRVVAKDPNGNIADSASSEVYFVVSSETKLMEVYNYPNPFANETYFTFRLSQIPEEVKIRIYTIAGRLIKVITKQSSELNYDLNKIYWNGRDEDGDVIANGTYLYKMIMKNADKTESVTQKLVIVK